MSNDRSLDDFLGDDADSDDDEQETEPVESSEEASDEGDRGDEETQVDEAIAPATPTYRFAPDGAACESCGETVEKRWHDDGQFVCADCKEW